MGQAAGPQLRPSSVSVVIFEPLLLPRAAPGGALASVVLRVHGVEGAHEEQLDSFPTTRTLPVWSPFADAAAGPQLVAPGSTGPAAAGSSEQPPVLELVAVGNDPKTGERKDLAKAIVPLAEFADLWRPTDRAVGDEAERAAQPASSNAMVSAMVSAAESIAQKGCAAGELDERRPVNGWATCVMLGLEGAEEDDPHLSTESRYRRGVELGKRLDVPKVFLALLDPAVGALCRWAPPVQRPPSTPRGIGVPPRPVHEQQREADTLCAVLREANALLQGLHRGLEDVEPADRGHGGEEGEEAGGRPPANLSSGLWTLGRHDREALLEENEVLRARLEDEMRRYEKEVNDLRIAYRNAMREREAFEGLASPAPSARGDEGGPEVNSGATRGAPGGDDALLARSPEQRRQLLLTEMAHAQNQTEELKQRLIDQRVRIAGVEHQALAADKDKEQTLKLFSASHQELKWMRDKYQENQRRREALEAEIAEVEQARKGGAAEAAEPPPAGTDGAEPPGEVSQAHPAEAAEEGRPA